LHKLPHSRVATIHGAQPPGHVAPNLLLPLFRIPSRGLSLRLFFLRGEMRVLNRRFAKPSDVVKSLLTLIATRGDGGPAID
jgi:hypothetical protein